MTKIPLTIALDVHDDLRAAQQIEDEVTRVAQKSEKGGMKDVGKRPFELESLDYGT